MPRSFSCSRRDFLRTGAALAGSCVALPTFIPRSALAATYRPGANDRIGIGYLAYGRRAPQLLGLPKETQIVAVSDVFLSRAEEFAAKRKCCSFQDYRRMLEMKDLDGVIISSPDHWHALHTIHACQAGKDVYVEKPISLTIREGRAMVDAARKYKRIVQVGSQQRSLAPNRHASALVRDGVLGKVHTVIAKNFPSPWEMRLPGQPVPEGLDWDAWCGQVKVVPFHNEILIPRSKPGWISLRPYSGGEMTGWGAHGFDQIQCALGMDHTGPVEVWVEGDPFQEPTFTEPVEQEVGEEKTDHPKVFFRYANGVVMKLGDAPGGGGIFLCEKGKITIDRNRYKVEPAELDKSPVESLRNRHLATAKHLQNWVDCMRSRQLPNADVEIGHRSTIVCHLGNIARWVGRKLTWDPVKEIFPGDREANQYLSRPQRRPYQLPKII